MGIFYLFSSHFLPHWTITLHSNLVMKLNRPYTTPFLPLIVVSTHVRLFAIIYGVYSENRGMVDAPLEVVIFQRIGS